MRALSTTAIILTALTTALLPPGSHADGELATIAARGELRILVRQCPDTPLPRIGSVGDMHRHAAAALARDLGVKPRFINVCDYSLLFDKLAAGQGDLIADHITITPDRAATVQFSTPLGMETQRLVTRVAEAGSITNLLDLKGRSIGVPRGTALADSARALQKLEPSINLFELPSDLSTDAILDMVTSRLVDLTMADGHIVREIEAYRDDVRGSLVVRPAAPVAWALPLTSHDLTSAANRLITSQRMAAAPIEFDTGDLDAIKARGTLRLLTRNSASCYFLWRGQLMGYEYEMVRHFAQQLGLHLDVIVPHTQQELIPMLKLGRGDLIAGFLTDTPARRAQGAAFSRPYHTTDELIIARKADAPTTRAALAGRTLVIRQASSYWETAAELRAAGLDITIKTAPPSMETEAIIAEVAAGRYDLTIADHHIYEQERSFYPTVYAPLTVKTNVPHGWAVRPGNTNLLAAIDAFWDREHRGEFSNLLYQRHFKRPVSATTPHRADRLPQGIISPYDALIRAAAARHQLDWRLVAAQLYQESQFNPDASSWMGARGLMQLMPATARDMGVTEILDPAQNIAGGVDYLAWLRHRFEPELDAPERLWFAIAAYNAGLGHVQDARRLASQRGLDPDRWFGHVEQAMLLLANPDIARHTRHGYVRGKEPVAYVRAIRDRYKGYANHIK